MTTVAGVYDNIQDAYQALYDLVGHGFAQRDLSIIANDATGEYADCLGQTELIAPDTSNKVALVSGIASLLQRVGAAVIPGVGEVLVGGPLFGLVGAGIVGTLVNYGVSKQTAGYYAEALRRGGTLVLVNADDKMADRASQLIDRHGPVDFARRVARWKSSGWTRFNPGAQAYLPEQINKLRDADQSANDRINAAQVG